MRKPKPATPFEQAVLDVVLVELRCAMRIGEQLSILIDPWVRGGGTYVYATPNDRGKTYEVANEPPPRPRKTRRRR